MKECSNWADAIADCALGGACEPELAGHLAICPECRNALEGSRAMAERFDQALHRSVAVEPPVYGPDRVMARIRGRTAVRTWWKWAAAIPLAMIAIVMWVRRPAPQADLTALSTWRSPTEALLRPPVAAAWTTSPRLGEGFFKMKTSGEKYAQ
jgi:predicted anti-sigma-YlaC factor YlaD